MSKRVYLCLGIVSVVSLLAFIIFNVNSNHDKLNKKSDVFEKSKTEITEKALDSKKNVEGFTATLGEYDKNRIFSVPENAKINSFCPGCEERGIDLIEGQYWEFIVSDDYKQYAYIRSDSDKKFVVLNGETESRYDNIYRLSFLDDGTLMYHAYNEMESKYPKLEADMTYAVYDHYSNIPIYAGKEGYPHAANGSSVTVGKNGKMAYGKVNRGEAKIHIMVHDIKKTRPDEDEEVNVVEGSYLHLVFVENDLHYVVLNDNNYSYYINDKVVRNISLDEFNSFYVWVSENAADENKQQKNNISEEGKKVFVNDSVIADYSDKNPEVYISNIIIDDEQSNLAYIVWTNESPHQKWISLNGDDSSEFFNDIKNLKFTEDGKLAFVGRRGRDVYRVFYDINNALFESIEISKQVDMDIIKKYYNYISNSDLQSAWEMKGNDVSWEVFQNRYKYTESVVPESLRRIGNHTYAFHVLYKEEYTKDVDRYDVVMRIEDEKIYTQTVYGEREEIILSKDTIVTIQTVNGKKEMHVLRDGRDYLLERVESEHEDGRNSWINYGGAKLVFDRYVIYKRYGWEYSETKIYDLKEEKHMVILPMLAEGSFTKNEDYFYACTLDHFGGTFYVDIYNVPSFKKVSDLLPLLNSEYSTYFKENLDCKYNSSTDKLVVNIVYNETPGALDDETLYERWEYDFEKKSWRKI